MDTVNTYFQSSVLPLFPNHGFYFFLCFLHHFFNTSRMDTTILNQGLESHTCNFTTNGIETRKDNHFWSIVNNNVNTC